MTIHGGPRLSRCPGPHGFAHHTRADPPQRSPVAAAVGVTGELLLTAGILVLLYAAYVLWGTGIQTARAQDEIALGDAYAILRVPRLGDDWEKIVVQGVELSDLARGPGHYPDTAAASELGNFSIAAHRSGHGAPSGHGPTPSTRRPGSSSRATAGSSSRRPARALTPNPPNAGEEI